MARVGVIVVKIAGWRYGCCYNVMACEGAPTTTSADIGTARRGWRPCGRHDEGDGQPCPAPYFNPYGATARHPRPAVPVSTKSWVAGHDGIGGQGRNWSVYIRTSPKSKGSVGDRSRSLPITVRRWLLHRSAAAEF